MMKILTLKTLMLPGGPLAPLEIFRWAHDLNPLVSFGGVPAKFGQNLAGAQPCGCLFGCDRGGAGRKGADWAHAGGLWWAAAGGCERLPAGPLGMVGWPGENGKDLEKDHKRLKKFQNSLHERCCC